MYAVRSGVSTGSIDLAATARELPVDDLHAAALICEERPGELHYVPQTATWYVWDGRCHRPDQSDAVGHLLQDFAFRYEYLLERARAGVRVIARMDDDESKHEALEKEGMKPFEAAVKYAAGLRGKRGHTSLLGMLQVACSVEPRIMEQHRPELINCANCTVDLRTGAWHPFCREDMLTYCLPVSYNPRAVCPMFEAMLYHVANDDPEAYFYLMKVLGHALIGANPEQIVVFINGPTKSGKSKVLEIVRTILGPAGHDSKADLITYVKGNGRNARRENSIRGKRLVTITETDSGMLIDEAQLKRLTGEGVISVDQHYAKEELQAVASWLIVLATNDMPSLLHFDNALKERVVVIPGGQTIPPEKRDKDLVNKILAAESEGVLALLIRACTEYYRIGRLEMPAGVQMETERYQGEQNNAAIFTAECCELEPQGGDASQWGARHSATFSIPRPESYDVYCRWARNDRIRLGRNKFYEAMEKLPGVTLNDKSNANIRYEGIRWNQEGLRILNVASK
jgi:putative DNA primase/helicase